MLPRRYIEEWKRYAPWPEDAQVEQDLVVEKALVQLFSPPTQKQFLLNLEEKLKDPDFKGDIYGLLRPGVEYDQDKAYELVKTALIEKI